MRVTVIGPVCWDQNIIKGRTLAQPGGVTYYTGNALESLGADVQIVASCGSDAPVIARTFQTPLHHVIAEGTVEFINEYYDPTNPDLRIQRARIAPNRIEPHRIKNQWLRECDYIILGPLFHDNISEDLVVHCSERAPVILFAQGMIRDLDNDRIVWNNADKLLSFLNKVTWLILDAQELAFITGSDDVVRGAKMLIDLGVKNVSVTDGKQGSHLVEQNGTIHRIPAYAPRVIVDPTGAGDSYCAGLLVGLERYRDMRKAGIFASMTATMSLENKGPFAGSISDVEESLGW